MNWNRELAALPSVPWLESIDFSVQSDQLEMVRQAKKIDIKPVSLSDNCV